MSDVTAYNRLYTSISSSLLYNEFRRWDLLDLLVSKLNDNNQVEIRGLSKIIDAIYTGNLSNLRKVILVKDLTYYPDRLENHLNEVSVCLNGVNSLRRFIPNFSYCYGKSADNKWSYFEYVPNTPFYSYIETENIVDLFYQLVLALDFAYHKIGFKHGDLHPANILVRNLDNAIAITYRNRTITTNKVVTVIDYENSTLNDNDEEELSDIHRLLYDEFNSDIVKMFVETSSNFDELIEQIEKTINRKEESKYEQTCILLPDLIDSYPLSNIELEQILLDDKVAEFETLLDNKIINLVNSLESNYDNSVVEELESLFEITSKLDIDLPYTVASELSLQQNKFFALVNLHERTGLPFLDFCDRINDKVKSTLRIKENNLYLRKGKSKQDAIDIINDLNDPVFSYISYSLIKLPMNAIEGLKTMKL